MASATRGKYSKREYAKLSGTIKPEKVAKTSKTSSSVSKYEKEYLKSLKPSKEETQAETTLNNLIQSEELGVKNVEKQAIPLGFIQGQSERLRNQATEQAIPLKLQLATLQARRQATSEVASKKYQFAVKKANDRMTKSSDPLDTEYKQTRNERAKLALAKAQTKGSGSSKSDWGAWTTKQVADPSDPLGRRKKTVSTRINKKTGEREQRD